MKDITIIGHFAKGENALNGQTIKTKIIADQLEATYGLSAIQRTDTAGGWRFFLKLPWIAIHTVATSRNIIMLPAHNGVRIIPLLMVLINTFFQRRLFYVVIGGWLPEFAQDKPLLRWALRRLDGIFPETQSMKQRLNTQGIYNVYVMPNTKLLKLVTPEDLPSTDIHPLRMCTFSRVMKTKGIEDAIAAVTACNKHYGTTAVTLDIYGQIEHDEEPWFANLQASFPDYVQYCGSVSYHKSSEVLSSYHALLFPTYYPGEGFAGTFLDAFAAGLPVIASDWHDNADIVKDGETGYIFTVRSVNSLANRLISIVDSPSQLLPLRQGCLNAARNYMPQNIISILTEHISL